MLCVSISIIIYLKKMILIDKVIEHNQVNDLCCYIKYLDLRLSLEFSSYVFSYQCHNPIWVSRKIILFFK